MTTITGTAGAGTAAAAPASKAPGAMDQTDFLRLMTTQLTTQDPFNPVDNTQMVAQMAQFSQVAGIAEINASLKTLVSNLGGSRLGDAASWIGKSVLVASEAAMPRADGSYAGEIALAEDADQLQLSLVDANGRIVHTADLGTAEAGTVPFAWDGKDADGAAVAGPVRIVVNAAKAGAAVAATPAAWTQVTGVQSPASGSGAQLLTGLGGVSPADALRLA